MWPRLRTRTCSNLARCEGSRAYCLICTTIFPRSPLRGRREFVSEIAEGGRRFGYELGLRGEPFFHRDYVRPRPRTSAWIPTANQAPVWIFLDAVVVWYGTTR